MGDGVNVAARLEGMNKTFGTTICISDSVYEAVAAKIVARPLRRVQVKGRKQAFMVYELLGIIDSDDPELAARADDKKLSEMTWVARRGGSPLFGDSRGVSQRLRRQINAVRSVDQAAEC
jgi:hypothetical protein